MSGTTVNKRRHFMVLSLAVVMLILLLAAPAHAQDMIARAKSNVITGGTFQKTSAGLKYKTSSGTYLRKKWCTIDGNVYYFNSKKVASVGWFRYKTGGSFKTYCASSKGVVYYEKFVRYKKKYYYLQSDGTRAQSTGLTIGKYYYTFDKNGVMTLKQKAETGTGSIGTTAPKVSFVFAGDSRTVGMASSGDVRKSVHYKTAFIGKVSMGYSWLESYAGNRVEAYLESNPKARVVFMFGVNDVGNISSYISYYRSLMNKWPKAKFYFVSVNPIEYPSWSSVTDAMIRRFNRKLKKAFPDNYIDTYTYLKKNGFSTVDTVHYTSATYNKIYLYVMKSITGK